MPRVTRRPLAAADIFELWDHIAEDSIDVVRVLNSARDIDAVFAEEP